MSESISQEALMRYLDGESPAAERQHIQAALERSTELRRELSIFEAMKEDLQGLTFQPSAAGHTIWDAVHRKVARPTAWVFVVVGVVIWSVYSGYLFLTSAANLLEKAATSAVVIGLSILLAGVVWEQYRARQTDPYRNVHR